MPGTMLFRINGLSTVWVNLDVPEAMGAAVRPGAPLVASVPAYPGEEFRGRVAAVLPEVNAATRTLRARAEISNPGGKLKPGMFAKVKLDERRGEEAVLVPTEAVIVTGERSVVIVDRGEGRYEPVDVTIGMEEGGKTEIVAGLKGGERVVASGQFLIDSEASLRGVERRMSDGAPSKAPETLATHRGEGRIERIDGNTITISHGPVASLKWNAMTMEFAAPKGGVPAGVAPGDSIRFDFVQTPAGEFAVTKIERVPRGKP